MSFQNSPQENFLLSNRDYNNQQAYLGNLLCDKRLISHSKHFYFINVSFLVIL
jgi:hypothetical protein